MAGANPCVNVNARSYKIQWYQPGQPSHRDFAFAASVDFSLGRCYDPPKSSPWTRIAVKGTPPFVRDFFPKLTQAFRVKEPSLTRTNFAAK
jgi:hypothetical protein